MVQPHVIAWSATVHAMVSLALVDEYSCGNWGPSFFLVEKDGGISDQKRCGFAVQDSVL